MNLSFCGCCVGKKCPGALSTKMCIHTDCQVAKHQFHKAPLDLSSISGSEFNGKGKFGFICVPKCESSVSSFQVLTSPVISSNILKDNQLEIFSKEERSINIWVLLFNIIVSVTTTEDNIKDAGIFNFSSRKTPSKKRSALKFSFPGFAADLDTTVLFNPPEVFESNVCL